MKRVAACLFAAVLTLAFTGIGFSQQKAKQKVKSNDEQDNNWGHEPGTWDAIIKEGIVNIQFYGKHWSNGRNFDAAELGSLPTDKIGEFSLTRELVK